MESLLRVLSGLGALAVGVVALPEAFVLIGWQSRRSKLYNDALKAAKEFKKPLLTVNCPDCPGQNVALSDLHAVPDRSFGAVFMDRGIERVMDIDSVLTDLYRVADKVFISTYPKESVFWSFPKKPVNIIHSAPPATQYIDYTDGTTGVQRKAFPALEE